MDRSGANVIVGNIDSPIPFTTPIMILTGILRALNLTIFAFKIETLIDSVVPIPARWRLFTTPQVFVFTVKPFYHAP